MAEARKIGAQAVVNSGGGKVSLGARTPPRLQRGLPLLLTCAYSHCGGQFPELRELQEIPLPLLFFPFSSQVLDTGRGAAVILGIPVVNCPSAASTDAPATGLSVVYKVSQRWRRMGLV